jgi:L-ascorbate metabolism protein UlaG (beta-lactamase superfamily)
MKYFVSLLILASISLISFSQQKKADVTYIANCEFMVETGNKQIIIDGLFKPVFNDYVTPPDSITTKIIYGQKPFDNLHLLLITHNHKDHFSDSLVVKYLNYNSNNVLIAPSLVTNAILNHPDYKKNKHQIVELNNANQGKNDTIIQGIRIQSFFLQHDNRPGVENAGYLIDMDGIKIFHTGDCTGADTMQFKVLQLQNKNIDLAFLNFYGYWKNQKKRDFTKREINPKQIVLMHIPTKEIDFVTDSTRKINKINNFIDISIFDKSMGEKTFVFE